MASYQAPREWEDQVRWLTQTLHGRSSWRFSIVLLGALFASGRRVVASWIRAAGVSHDYQDFYFCLQSVGRRWKEQGLRPVRFAAGRDEETSGTQTHLRRASPLPGETGRSSPQLGGSDLHGLRERDDQTVQDVPGDAPHVRRSDPGGHRAGADGPAVFLLHGCECHGDRDYRSVRRPVGDRAGVPRCEGSLGERSAAGAKPVVEHRRVAHQPVAAYAGGTVGVEPLGTGTGAPGGLALGSN